MKVLVIVQHDLDIQVGYISSQLNEDVKLNSVTEDGVSIFQCGTPLPDVNDWDWVAQVGTCTAEVKVPVEVQISSDGDYVGDLIAAVMAVKEGQDTDEALGEG